ncbi:hypothetical protein THTE_2918 [Thermogutta terrifontis]|uniref:Uncharacterized protein n=1 Tax=Thermogutta terrifontis TaxID=1331910 RepID=A0A286RHT5_9BACT|nr:hypothetical protein THTE_2918 [Thermogutta terrifontis]
MLLDFRTAIAVSSSQEGTSLWRKNRVKRSTLTDLPQRFWAGIPHGLDGETCSGTRMWS